MDRFRPILTGSLDVQSEEYRFENYGVIQVKMLGTKAGFVQNFLNAVICIFIIPNICLVNIVFLAILSKKVNLIV